MSAPIATNDRATAALVAVAEAVASSGQLTVSVTIEGITAELPASVAAEIAVLLRDIGEGRRVTSAPYDLTIGTKHAAAELGVSRQWLTTMLDRGDIPMVRDGSKRRVRLGDLMNFRRAHGQRRRNVIAAEPLLASEPARAQPAITQGTDATHRPTSRWRSSTPPHNWSETAGPTVGIVELPFHLYWSDDNNRFDISKPARLRSMYQTVLTEGSDDDVRTFLNQQLLLAVWDQLWLSPAVHEAWDGWIEEHRHAVV